MQTLTHIPVHLGGVVSQRTGANLDPYPGTPGGEWSVRGLVQTLTHIPVHLGGVVVSQRTGENIDPYPGTPGGSGGQSEDWCKP